MSFRLPALAVSSAIVVAAACSDTTPPSAPGRSPAIPSLAINPAAVCNGVAMPAGDCQALVALYNSTNGPGWTDRTNWGNANPCTWVGIVCTDGDHGSVRRITLASNQLAGTIPAALGTLESLDFLALSANDLTGSIPAALGDLPKLENFQAFNNHLSGSIPAALGNVATLRFLSLNNNDLTGSIPAALANATNLEWLWLRDNALSGSIPAALGSLTNLTYLDLGGNALTGTIPAALGNLSQLDVLALDENQISGTIPASLGALSNLRVLHVDENLVAGPIPDLTQWPKLDRTRLGANQFTGQVPLAVAIFGENLPFTCAFAPGNPGLFVPDLPAYRAADIDGDGTICGLAFSSAEDIGEDAVDEIEDLVPATLNAGQANALTTKIENAVAKADKGQYAAAINQMQSFLTQLADMVAAGTLTPAQAAPFIQQAQALIAIWTDQL